MNIKEETKLVTTKSFSFSGEEAAVLADILMNKVDWEEYQHGEHYEFLCDLYVAMEAIGYES